MWIFLDELMMSEVSGGGITSGSMEDEADLLGITQ